MAVGLQHDPMRSELARLRDAVLADERLAAALLELWRPDTFVARAAEAAAEHGVALDAGQIGEMLHGPGRRSAPLLDLAPPPGWLPGAVTREGGGAAVRWVYFGGRRLREPAYEESLAIVAPRPFNRLFGFSTALPLAPSPGALAPAGLIFHMSRCGSTLASQMLATSDANIVVAEAPAIDEVVRSGDDGPSEDVRVAQLRGIVGAFGQPRGGERRLFVKLDCWHTRALPLFRRAFPAAPWVFLHRDPTEVLVSLMRRPGFQTNSDLVPPAFYGIDGPDERPFEDYAARVLAAICEAALDGLDGAGRLVSYDELPQALWTRVLPHFGIEPTRDEVTAMQKMAARDAKQPTRAFQPDSAEKRAAASDGVRRAVERRLADVRTRLAAARQSGPAEP